MKKTNKKAFTLAEVLITLGIIGVVAALTIPTLINNYQTKSWNTAAKVFEAKFTESLKTMNVQGQLGKYGKYDSTEGFVEELQKHFKITKVCDRDHLMQCFEKNITMNDEKIALSSIKTAKDFGQDNWNTNIMGIQFANGVTGLIAYNPECKGDPHNNRITGGDCYALVYDTSGFSEPNEIGKDARMNANVLKLGGDVCAFEIDGTCYGLAFIPEPHVWNNCSSTGKSTHPDDIAFMDQYGILYCTTPGIEDYWAGAVKACGGKDKILNKNHAREIAKSLYNGATRCPEYTSCRDNDKFLSLGLTDSLSNVWLAEEDDLDRGSSAIASIGGSGLDITDNATRNRSTYSTMCIQD